MRNGRFMTCSCMIAAVLAVLAIWLAPVAIWGQSPQPSDAQQPREALPLQPIPPALLAPEASTPQNMMPTPQTQSVMAVKEPATSSIMVKAAPSCADSNATCVTFDGPGTDSNTEFGPGSRADAVAHSGTVETGTIARASTVTRDNTIARANTVVCVSTSATCSGANNRTDCRGDD